MPRIYVPPKVASPILSQSVQEGISIFQRRNCDSMVGESWILNVIGWYATIW